MERVTDTIHLYWLEMVSILFASKYKYLEYKYLEYEILFDEL